MCKCSPCILTMLDLLCGRKGIFAQDLNPSLAVTDSLTVVGLKDLLSMSNKPLDILCSFLTLTSVPANVSCKSHWEPLSHKSAFKDKYMAAANWIKPPIYRLTLGKEKIERWKYHFDKNGDHLCQGKRDIMARPVNIRLLNNVNIVAVLSGANKLQIVKILGTSTNLAVHYFRPTAILEAVCRPYANMCFFGRSCEPYTLSIWSVMTALFHKNLMFFVEALLAGDWNIGANVHTHNNSRKIHDIRRDLKWNCLLWISKSKTIISLLTSVSV